MTLHAQVGVPFEFTLAPVSRGWDAEVDVTFTGPDGATWKVPAFWAGESSFRVRFAPPAQGRYAYASTEGEAGEIEAVAYAGRNDLYRHGRLRVAASRRTLEHSDGTPFFW